MMLNFVLVAWCANSGILGPAEYAGGHHEPVDRLRVRPAGILCHRHPLRAAARRMPAGGALSSHRGRGRCHRDPVHVLARNEDQVGAPRARARPGPSGGRNDGALGAARRGFLAIAQKIIGSNGAAGLADDALEHVLTWPDRAVAIERNHRAGHFDAPSKFSARYALVLDPVRKLHAVSLTASKSRRNPKI